MQFVRYSRLRAAKGFGMGLTIHDRVCLPPLLPSFPSHTHFPLPRRTQYVHIPTHHSGRTRHPTSLPSVPLPIAPFRRPPLKPIHHQQSTVIKSNQTKSNHHPKTQPRQPSEPPPPSTRPTHPPYNPGEISTLPPPLPNPETPPVILHPSVPTSTTEPPLPSRARDPTARR